MTLAYSTSLALLAASFAFVPLLNASGRAPLALLALRFLSAQGILYPLRYGYASPCNGRTYARWRARISAPWSYRWSYFADERALCRA